jgi:hypothetical protein
MLKGPIFLFADKFPFLFQWHLPGSFFSVVSRAVVIDFKAPSVAPQNVDEEDNYSELEVLINSGALSTVVGWAIKQGKLMMSKEGKEDIMGLKDVCLMAERVRMGLFYFSMWNNYFFWLGQGSLCPWRRWLHTYRHVNQLQVVQLIIQWAPQWIL